MNKRYFYDNGLPFSDKLSDNLKDLKYRVDTLRKASLIVIDGGVGEGKTTLAVHVAEFLESEEIIFSKQLGLGGIDFAKKLKECHDLEKIAIIYDEAGDFNRRGALTRFNAMLNRIFETFRAFKIIVILCLPSFHVLDEQLLDKQIPRLLLHCHNKNTRYGSFKAYSLYRMFYVKDKMKKMIVKPFAYKYTEPNFIGHFLDLTPERSLELDKYSTKGKLDILDNAEVKFDGLLAYSEIAERLNRSIIWVKKTVLKLKISHKTIVKKVKYFNPDVLNILHDEMDNIRIKND